MSSRRRPPRWDVFCRIVDHFGDAAVCWRLARILAQEHGIAVTLWIDRPATLAALVPGLDPGLDTQRHDAVTVRVWPEPFPDVRPADVVVDAFVAGVPDRYAAAMVQRNPPPRWFELEYLATEPAFDDIHGKPSPHPRLPLMRTWWVPGFSPRTGGLLREAGLLERRDRFVESDAARSALWSRLRVPAPAHDEIRLSVFSYPHANHHGLRSALQAGSVAVTAVVTEGDAFARGPDGAPLSAGSSWSEGELTVHVIRFLSHDEYDRLLWSCDANFVRGEDSFVRAQWAARPLVWLPYPQAEGAHRAKLAAFAERYTEGPDSAVCVAWRGLVQLWNAGVEERPGDDAAEAAHGAWIPFVRELPKLAQHAREWADRLSRQQELAAGLVEASLSSIGPRVL